MEEPKDSGETEKEESSDVEEEKKSRDWTDQVDSDVDSNGEEEERSKEEELSGLGRPY